MLSMSTQELRDTPHRGRKYLFNKRGWVRATNPYRTVLGWEAVVPRKLRDGSLSLGVRFDEPEREVVFNVSLGASVYLILHPRSPRFWKILNLDRESRQRSSDRDVQTFGGERDISLRIFDGAIWWNLWSMSGCGRHDDPWWRRGNFDPVDFALGCQRYHETVLDEAEVDIPMPEGTYRWRVKLLERTWKRPRWPWVERRAGFKADCIEGEHIPHPGKGENSYDCGSDATFGMSGPGETFEAAIAGVVETVLRSRRRYGRSHQYVTDGKYDERAA